MLFTAKYMNEACAKPASEFGLSDQEEIAQTRAKAAKAAPFLLQFEDQDQGEVCEGVLRLLDLFCREHGRPASRYLTQAFEDVVTIGCQLLSKYGYGNASVEEGLRDLIEELTDEFAVADIAISALDKIKTREGIQ
jgi:hypothetical protein